MGDVLGYEACMDTGFPPSSSGKRLKKFGVSYYEIWTQIHIMETPHSEISSLIIYDIFGTYMPKNIRVKL